jgi:hypothetical protein
VKEKAHKRAQATIPKLSLQAEAEIETIKSDLLRRADFSDLYPARGYRVKLMRQAEVLKSRLVRVAATVFARQAVLYRRYSNSHRTLHRWFIRLAEIVADDVIADHREQAGERYEFHCSEADQRVAIQDHLNGMVPRFVAAAAAAPLRDLQPLQKQRRIRRKASSDAAGTLNASGDPVGAERQAALQAYKDECRQHGIKVTDLMVAKAAAGWNDRTPVARWKANDDRCTSDDDTNIRGVLKRKPHLK